MFPDLITMGPITLHTYGLLVALGFFAGLLTAVKIGKSSGLNPQQVMDLTFFMILSGLIGSRIFYVLLNLSYYIRNPVDILKLWQGGLVFSGGILAAVLALVWFVWRHKVSFFKLCDILAPGAAIGQAIGRIGCLMAGCCYGAPTEAWWGITFTHPNSLAPLHVSLHPAQIYSSLSGFLIFAILLFLNAKKRYEGQVFLWFLILHSTARLAIERFRGDDRGMLFDNAMTVTQFVSLLTLVGAVVMLFVLGSKAKKKKQAS